MTVIRNEPGKPEPMPGNGNGAVFNARTVLGVSKQIGEMSDGELDALAGAAVRTLRHNRPSSAPTATTPLWSRLFARLDMLTRPLLSAGWTVAERSKEDAGSDEGTPIPPSAELTLTRAHTRAHVELYEDGVVLVWPPEDAYSKTDPDSDIDPKQASEPLTQDQARELFRQVGLLP